MRAALGLTLLLALSAPAFAGSTKFSAWEGPADRTGAGGTREVYDGIDIWTTGDPPRRYRILGVLTREQRDRGLGQMQRYLEAIKQAGGDAGIVMSKSQANTGTFMVTEEIGAAITRTTVQMMVVEYIQ